MTNQIPILSPYISDADATRILLEHRVKLQWSIGENAHQYMLDHHYKVFVLRTIHTVEDALAMCDKLDAEHKERDWSDHCHKATEIRRWLTEDSFWTKSPERIRSAIAANRRICCGVHEAYSFAIREKRL